MENPVCVFTWSAGPQHSRGVPACTPRGRGKTFEQVLSELLLMLDKLVVKAL